MAKSAAGAGTIRKKTITRNGKTYQFWEARYTEGYHPGTGRQIQRSITGKTQKEVSQKLKAATSAIDAGTYTAPNKMTVGQWLDIWIKEYTSKIKPRTVESYTIICNNHLKPGLGATRLDKLEAYTVQTFYNGLSEKKGLSAKTVKNVHGVLHKALQQAVKNKYISFNPADDPDLPSAEKPEIKPLDDEQIKAFLKAVKGHKYEYLFVTVPVHRNARRRSTGPSVVCCELYKGNHHNQ